MVQTWVRRRNFVGRPTAKLIIMVNVLIGCTGSVATIKLPDLVRDLLDLGAKVWLSWVYYNVLVKTDILGACCYNRTCQALFRLKRSPR